MAETLLQFPTSVRGEDGVLYLARAVGAEVPGGNWQGWIEFTPVGGGAPLSSGRETTQPNRTDTAYWATGLTPVYLEGALSRAQRPAPAPAQPAALPPPAFDAPARPVFAPPRAETAPSVLNPFSVYEKGESLLRRQLGALSAWHLVNIIVHYELSDQSRAVLDAMPASALIEAIVDGVRYTVDRPAGRSGRAARS